MLIQKPFAIRDNKNDALLMLNDDYDSPWKAAIDGYFPDFMAFYFPDIDNNIDWSKSYESLDNELDAVVRDSKIGKRYADKLVKVTRLDGTKGFVYIHIEVQGQVEKAFAQRMFTYNYRIYDKYGQFPVSLAVLADENEHWKPQAFRYEEWGFRLEMHFPVVKLMDYRNQVDALLAEHNPFAILTAAHILTKRTKQSMDERLRVKIKVMRLLYAKGWDKQALLNFFAVIDWLMYLPKALTIQFKHEIHQIEEEDKMRYVTSIERLAIEEGISQGISQGKILLLKQVLAMKFPNADLSRYQISIDAAAEDDLVRYTIKAAGASSLDDVFDV
jgi:hypothetical protein